MAVLIMRLKLLATPQLCAITSLCVSKSLLRSIYTRNSRIRWIVFTLLLAGMTFKGVDNIKEQWALRGEYSNPSQERLFQWINMSTHTDAVFAGSMAVMANVKLSTGRPIVNHPHYESEIVRNRTIAVYSMYSRKPLEEVFFVLKSMGVDFYVFQPDICTNEQEKPQCTYLAMFALEDPENEGKPSLCHTIWHAVLTKNDFAIRPFRVVYTDPLYSTYYVVLSLA